MRWIGLRSYSLYLWHYPIFCVTRPGLDVPLHGWPDLALRLVLSFGAAELSYRYVETPIRGGAIGRYLAGIRTAHGAQRQRAGAAACWSRSPRCSPWSGWVPASPSRRARRRSFPAPRPRTRTTGDSADAQTLAELTRATRPNRGDTGGDRRHRRARSNRRDRRNGRNRSRGPGHRSPTASLSHEILAIGDSVMLGAEQSLEHDIPGIFVDAKVSRQFWDATVVLQAYKTEGLLPPTIVIHMGTNGAFSDAQFDQMMAVLGKRRVFFVNAHEPRTWETEVNERLAADVRKYPNAHLIDWHDYGNQHPDWFVSDGIHLTGAGAEGYAFLIRRHLALQR